MKKINNFIIAILAILFSFSSIGCTPKTTNNKTDAAFLFVGIAIYQNLETNTRWNEIKNDSNKINNLIRTNNNEIEYSESVPYLFYVYSKTAITENVNNPISNTTTKSISVSQTEINFEFERILENTDVLIYYIYKDNNSNYYLTFAKEQDNITSATTTISLGKEKYSDKNINLKLQINLSSKTEY